MPKVWIATSSELYRVIQAFPNKTWRPPWLQNIFFWTLRAHHIPRLDFSRSAGTSMVCVLQRVFQTFGSSCATAAMLLFIYMYAADGISGLASVRLVTQASFLCRTLATSVQVLLCVHYSAAVHAQCANVFFGTLVTTCICLYLCCLH